MRGNSPKKGYREDKMIVCNCISIDLPAVITHLTPPPGLSPAFNDMTSRDKAVTLLNGGGGTISNYGVSKDQDPLHPVRLG